MTNQRERHTSSGAVNWLTHEFHLKAFAAGKGEYTVAYLHWLRECYPGKRLSLIWDGASYHRDTHVTALRTQGNDGLAEKAWQLDCVSFAPNAPDQNPVEDIWLQAKNHLRRHFAQNKTFAAVKNGFFHLRVHCRFDSAKFAGYCPVPPVI